MFLKRSSIAGTNRTPDNREGAVEKRRAGGKPVAPATGPTPRNQAHGHRGGTAIPHSLVGHHGTKHEAFVPMFESKIIGDYVGQRKRFKKDLKT